MIIVFNVKICALDLDYDKHAEITLLPSAEQANCNTDVNLDNEDEPTGLISHLPTWPGSSCRRFRSSGWRQANQVKALERLLIYIWSNSLREIYKSHAKKVLIEGTKYLPSFHLVKFPPPFPAPLPYF